MRHWQPLHHARWRAFLAGIETALRTRTVVETATVELPSAAPFDAPAEAPAAVFVQTSPEPTAVAPTAPADPTPITLSPPLFTTETTVTPVEVAPTATAPEPLPIAAPASSPPPEAPEILAFPPAAFVPPGNDLLPSAPLHFPGTARLYFSSLAWNGLPLRNTPAPTTQATTTVGILAPAAGPVPPPAPDPVSAPAPSRAAAGAFFRTLPWAGVPNYGEVITAVRITATRSDSGLDPRTAALPGDNLLLTGLLSAARTSDRLATTAGPGAPPPPAAPRRAGAYFSTLPWAHA
jgi:hypothetical protein